LTDELAGTGLVVLVDKPSGPTSHDIVARTRREHGVKRVGHAGTLDPFATGLLIVLIGREATREQARFMALRKTYRVTTRFGATSTTGDRDGALEQTGVLPADPQIASGDLMQRPPAYSAVKVGGEALYKKARRGEAMEGEARPVTVHRAERLWTEGDRAAFEIECSSGTYIRQLVADLGDAYCDRLERTAIGPFGLHDADPDRVVGVGEALSFLPERPLTQTEAGQVGHGVRIAAGDAPAAEALRLTHGGELIAVAEPRGPQLAPVVVFAG